mmetsp:Transcript_11705/g.16786  ORF Transcript_11705/g.16786 Transcript_11705/m.16786 type:complete len:168 (-) Transcript_11705:1007-1510(-)
MYAEECDQRSELSGGASATSSSSAAAAIGHANDVNVTVKSSTTTKTVTDKRIANNILKEDGCDIVNITGSDGKNAMQNDDDDASTSIQSQSQPQPQETTFPQHLMDVIESETTDDNAVTVNGQKAIEWLSTGDKFIIRDKVALESRVLPKYFNNKCKSMSFIRKLYR